MPVKFTINGIPATGVQDGRYEWYLTADDWTWTDGVRPPAPDYVGVSVLRDLEVHTVNTLVLVLAGDGVMWYKIFADIARYVMSDHQLNTSKLTVYDDNTPGVPNDKCVGP